MSQDPESPFEDEGIPDTHVGSPAQRQDVDPEQEPVPAEEPVAADDHGVTSEESTSRESLDERLGRERPDVEPGGAAAADHAATTEPDEGVAEERRAGRLTSQDTDPQDAPTSADDVGEDTGGLAQEEQAMRVEDEERG